MCIRDRFYIGDAENQFRILYELEIDLGVFLNEDYPRRIISENLFVNGEPVFQRSGRLYLGNMKVIKGYLSSVTVQNPDSISEIAENSLSQDELFLTNGFRLVVSPAFARLIADWFADKFMVICRAASMQLIKRFADPKKKAVYIEKTTDPVPYTHLDVYKRQML